MKYTIEGFQQEKLFEWGLDAADAVILRYLTDFYNTGQMKKFEINGISYFWVHYQTILNEIPILRIKKPALRGRFRKFTDCGLMNFHLEKNSQGTYTYYRFNENKYIELITKTNNPPKNNLDRGQNETITKDHNTNIVSKDTITDSKESAKQNNNSSKLEKSKKNSKQIKDLPKNEIVEYWLSKKQKYPRITLHKSPNAKAYQKAKRYIMALKKGEIYRHIQPDRTKISKKLLNKKWTDEEIKKIIDDMCLLYLDGYWPENKDRVPKILSEFIYNPRTGTSWFFNIVQKPPKKLWEETEIIDKKALEKYTKFYGDYLDSNQKKAKLNKLVNDLIRKQRRIYSEIGEGLLSTGFRSKFGYAEDPDSFVIQHLKYIGGFPRKSLRLLRTDNGVWTEFVKWFKDFHGYDISCTEPGFKDSGKPKKKVSEKKKKRIRDKPLVSADPLLDSI